MGMAVVKKWLKTRLAYFVEVIFLAQNIFVVIILAQSNFV